MRLSAAVGNPGLFGQSNRLGQGHTRSCCVQPSWSRKSVRRCLVPRNYRRWMRLTHSKRWTYSRCLSRMLQRRSPRSRRCRTCSQQRLTTCWMSLTTQARSTQRNQLAPPPGASTLLPQIGRERFSSCCRPFVFRMDVSAIQRHGCLLLSIIVFHRFEPYSHEDAFPPFAIGVFPDQSMTPSSTPITSLERRRHSSRQRRALLRAFSRRRRAGYAGSRHTSHRFASL